MIAVIFKGSISLGWLFITSSNEILDGVFSMKFVILIAEGREIRRAEKKERKEREREGEREKAVGIEVLATILLLGTQVLFLWKMLPIKKKWGRRNVVSCVTTSRKSYFTTLCYVFASRVPIRCHSNLETSLRQRNVARSARRRKHWRWRDWL